jgi:hypothetical protein
MALGLVWLPCLVLGWLSSAPALSVLFWWALCAAPTGALAACGHWRGAVLVPMLWGLVAGVPWADFAQQSAVFPRPWAGAAALLALYLVGFSLANLCGAMRPRRCLAVAAALWVVAGLLCALPSGAGLLARPFPAEALAVLFDISPQVWVFEVAGFDWLRHPAVYEPAGAADLDPTLRTAWGFQGALAALAASLILALVTRRVIRK